MTLNERARVEIIGAGPAGLSAALGAWALGAEVIVHEMRNEVGARFHGDFQGLENWSQELDVLAELDRYSIGTEFMHAPVREIICFDPVGAAHRVRSARPIFYLVRRGGDAGAHDHALKTQAIEAGIQIQFGDRCRHLQGRGIVAEGPHRADVIAVGYVFESDMADGCFAAISDHLAPGGCSYVVTHGGAGRDPGRVLNRIYQPAAWKRVLACLVAGTPKRARVKPGCDCTWCRCHRERGSVAITA